MEHTVERYTDCFETFLREPNEATYTQVCAERYRRKQSGQSVDRREERSRFFQLLHAYQREQHPLYLQAMSRTDARLTGARASDTYVDILKLKRRCPDADLPALREAFFRNCAFPEMVKEDVYVNRPLRKAGKLCEKLLSPAKKAGDFAYHQYWYGKRGYSSGTLKAWNRQKKADTLENPYAEPQLMRWAHRNGFLYDRIDQYGLTEANCGDFVSDRDYISLGSVNNSYKKWIEDVPSLRYCLTGVTQYLPEMYYHVLRRDDKAVIVRMPDCPAGYAGGDARELLRLLREKGRLLFRPASYHAGAPFFRLAYDGVNYIMNRRPVTEEALLYTLQNRRHHYVLMELVDILDAEQAVCGADMTELRAVILNEQLTDPRIVDLRIVYRDGDTVQADPVTGVFDDDKQLPLWQSVSAQIREFCLFMPQLEYYSIHFRITAKGLCVMSCNPAPALLHDGTIDPRVMDYLCRKRDERCYPRPVVTVKRIQDRGWKLFKKVCCRPGYRDYMLHEYVNGVLDDLRNFHNTTLRQKLWSYRRGYYSFRIDQYQLTEDNWRDFLSDRDYHWLCPINNHYQKWIDDKMTYRHVIEPFKDAAPRYYYHIMQRNGVSCALRMEDCPAEYPSDFEGIVSLLEHEGALALKQSAGEHGDGFCKLSYADGKYYINHDEVDRDAVLTKLRSLDRYYNVTEFLTMHEALRPIYPGSVNTIRVMVLNPTGCDPYIANAYMRIGTGSTKLTDNLGYGGVSAKVDVDTGRFYDGTQLKNHVITSCPNHPDTGMLIEGQLPEWDKVKQTLTDICNYFGQLEYLGFDVAISSQGIRILEINKYQDLNRCAYYGDTIQNYFKDKIAAKNKRLHLHP